MGKKKNWIFPHTSLVISVVFTVPKLEPRLFSFNAPIGACSNFVMVSGITEEVDVDNLIPRSFLNLFVRGVIPLLQVYYQYR